MPLPVGKLDAAAPLIGVPACVKQIHEIGFHAVASKYVDAIAAASGGLPLLIPALGSVYEIADLVGRLDGLLVTGSVSNVAVHLYGGPPDRPDSPQDPARDATTLPLIRAALEAGLPLLCICRGLQELNVALGGTLHTQIHLVEGFTDHRSPRDGSHDERYGLRHPAVLVPGGVLHRLVGADKIQVNSLHWQGIDRLADRLAVEARAPDGVVEAVSVKDSKGFALAVQWHPEYKVEEDAASKAIFAAFGAAAAAFAARRRRAAGRAA